MKVVVSLKSTLPGHPGEVQIPLRKLGVLPPRSSFSDEQKKLWQQGLEQKLYAHMFECQDEDFEVTGWRLEK